MDFHRSLAPTTTATLGRGWTPWDVPLVNWELFDYQRAAEKVQAASHVALTAEREHNSLLTHRIAKLEQSQKEQQEQMVIKMAKHHAYSKPLEAQLRTKTTNISKLRAVIADRQTKIQELVESAKKRQAENEELAAGLTQLVQANFNLSTARDTLKTQVVQNADHIKDLKKRIKGLEKDKQALIEDYEKKINGHHEQYHDDGQTIDRKDKEIEKLKKDIADHGEQFLQMICQINTLKKRLSMWETRENECRDETLQSNDDAIFSMPLPPLSTQQLLEVETKVFNKQSHLATQIQKWQEKMRTATELLEQIAHLKQRRSPSQTQQAMLPIPTPVFEALPSPSRSDVSSISSRSSSVKSSPTLSGQRDDS